MLYIAVSSFWVFYQPAVLETTLPLPWKCAEWMNYWRRKEAWIFAQQKGNMCVLAAFLEFRVLCPPALPGPEPVCSIPAVITTLLYCAEVWEGLQVLTLIQLRSPNSASLALFLHDPKTSPKTADSWLHTQFIHSMIHTLCYLHNAVKSSEIKYCLICYYFKNFTQKTRKTDKICIPILECSNEDSEIRLLQRF